MNETSRWLEMLSGTRSPIRTSRNGHRLLLSECARKGAAMGLYNFHRRFEPYILDGSKTHTIRARRKHPDTPGKTMYLYCGLRQPGAQLLLVAPCVKVQEIKIELRPAVPDQNIVIDGVALTPDERDAFAWSDGFRHPDDELDQGYCWFLMAEFWAGRPTFEGRVYHWDYKRAVA
jgi:hypothetical protein